MTLTSNPERTSEVIQNLMEWYSGKDGKREGLMSSVRIKEFSPPEGVEQGSYEHIMWLTLTVSIDYQRDADALWDSARMTWKDEFTRWVFIPGEFRKKAYDDLVIALARYGLSRKPNRDAKIWWKVSNSFLNLFEGDPRKLFELYNYDAGEIYNQMRSKYKADFPYLAGASATSKILSLWLRMMEHSARVNLHNMENVPLPIDIHTAKATLTTGCLVGDFDGSFKDLVRQAQLAWQESCKKSGVRYYPLELDEPLWNLSRLGCSTRINGSMCPLRTECKLFDFCTANSPDAIISLSKGKVQVHTKYPKQEQTKKIV